MNYVRGKGKWLRVIILFIFESNDLSIYKHKHKHTHTHIHTSTHSHKSYYFVKIYIKCIIIIYFVLWKLRKTRAFLLKHCKYKHSNALICV